MDAKTKALARFRKTSAKMRAGLKALENELYQRTLLLAEANKKLLDRDAELNRVHESAARISQQLDATEAALLAEKQDRGVTQERLNEKTNAVMRLTNRSEDLHRLLTRAQFEPPRVLQRRADKASGPRDGKWVGERTQQIAEAIGSKPVESRAAEGA